MQDFPAFLVNLPDGCFNKGITRKEVLELFEQFAAALHIGLVERVDKNSMNPEKLWGDHVSPDDVDKICIANGIQPTKCNNANIKKLLEKNIPFPYDGIRPTQLLKDCYASFIDLYVEEIKCGSKHFHPLFFKSLWEEVRGECMNEDVEKKVKRILAAPYWKDRLYKAGKEEDDDDFDEDDYDDDDDE